MLKKTNSQLSPGPTKSETQEMVSCNLHLNELPEWFPYKLKFKNHCPTAPNIGLCIVQ